ncbi:hypothetical protein B1222_11435 [Paenibacillus larvae subsp. pulvifaciens]|uniref:hypothetical protein n=1 Tax=Paenibacillus larvae TaxID=1464 RepID=UPI00098ED739|nr:hypothetical protein [Paenibacillus larvae]AQT84852.1 hypothetical protein B1222_11435 [Paenibacillus larvae subsp. pulvifaciens]
MKKVLLYLLAGFATLIFIFLLGNFQHGYTNKPSDELIQDSPNQQSYVKSSRLKDTQPYDELNT